MLNATQFLFSSRAPSVFSAGAAISVRLVDRVMVWLDEHEIYPLNLERFVGVMVRATPLAAIWAAVANTGVLSGHYDCRGSIGVSFFVVMASYDFILDLLFLILL